MTNSENPNMLLVSSMVGRNHGPRVCISWGDKEGSITPKEARNHARILMECAEAAETDGFLWKLFNDMQYSEKTAAGIVADFRRMRYANNGEIPIPPHDIVVPAKSQQSVFAADFVKSEDLTDCSAKLVSQIDQKRTIAILWRAFIKIAFSKYITDARQDYLERINKALKEAEDYLAGDGTGRLR